MESKTRRWLLCGLLVVAMIVGGVVWFVLRAKEASENAYAVWNVADFVIDYMDTHDGQWPRNWDDLAAMDELQNQRRVTSEEMEDYQSRVEVDFSADPKQLLGVPWSPGQKDPPFQIIRFRHGPRAWYNEPNEMIWYYLHGERPSVLRAKRDSTTLPATQRAGERHPPGN